jgi:hypothetical protein
MADAPRQEPAADPRAALLLEQATRIAVLETVPADLRGWADGREGCRVKEQR